MGLGANIETNNLISSPYISEGILQFILSDAQINVVESI